MVQSSFHKSKRVLLVLLAPVLLLSTYFMFGLLKELLGDVLGYLGGFLFYWIFWCLIIPISIIGSKNIKQLFKKPKNKLGNPRWVGAIFLAGPVIAPFFTMFLSSISSAGLFVIVISIVFALVNGSLEELLWRGVFVKVFDDSWIWGYLYPSVMFGYWHLSPQVIFASQMPGGAFAFATTSIFMGLTFGWIAKKTRSIRYTTTAHILTDFMGLAGFAFLNGGYLI
jgi:membrane protease YdiL (CAAX protease family)